MITPPRFVDLSKVRVNNCTGRLLLASPSHGADLVQVDVTCFAPLVHLFRSGNYSSNFWTVVLFFLFTMESWVSSVVLFSSFGRDVPHVPLVCTVGCVFSSTSWIRLRSTWGRCPWLDGNRETSWEGRRTVRPRLLPLRAPFPPPLFSPASTLRFPPVLPDPAQDASDVIGELGFWGVNPMVRCRLIQCASSHSHDTKHVLVGHRHC